MQESLRGVDRFWTAEGAENRKDVVFVDSDLFGLYEHSLYLNGQWGNVFTCSHGDDTECEVCKKAGFKTRAYSGILTVMDCTKFTNRDGKDSQFKLKLFPASAATVKKLEIKVGDHGPLGGSMYKILRTEKKSARVGDDFTYVRGVNMAAAFEQANYMGKKMPQWFDEAEKSEAGLQALTRTFSVRRDDNGKLIRELVPFNYVEVLKPLPAATLRLILASYKGQGDDQKTGDDF
jgi:hypothetical protein